MDREKRFVELTRDVDLWCMVDKLKELGFFAAPASTRFHGAYEGGLFDHSYVVTEALLDLTEKLGLKWQRESSPYIVGLLHDLCKCDLYILTDDGYIYNKAAAKGHGDKSVEMISKLFALTEEETACIRWHMGAFDEKKNWNCYNEAIKKFPNVLYTHTADMIAAQIKEI